MRAGVSGERQKESDRVEKERGQVMEREAKKVERAAEVTGQEEV